MKLKEILKSNRKNKKWAALFELDNGEFDIVHFGDIRYTDYTLDATVRQRINYLNRHKKDVRFPLNSPARLSYHILWGPNKNMYDNIDLFKKSFNL